MKNYTAFLAGTLFLAPSIAHADVILPSMMVTMGIALYWPLVLLVVFLESVVLKIVMKISLPQAILFAIVMNVISTIIGVIIMFFMDIGLLSSFEYIQYNLHEYQNIFSKVVESSLLFLYAVPLFLLSVLIEYLVLLVMKAPANTRKQAAIYANIASYVFLGLTYYIFEYIVTS